MQDDETDVIIVGGGFSGLVAANRMAQLGLKPLVLEKGTDEFYFCNGRLTGGAVHACYRDVNTAPAELEEAIAATNPLAAGSPLSSAIANNARRVVDFLMSEGLRFIKAGPQEYQNRVLAPPRPNYPGLHWQGRGGDVMIRTLEANLVKRGGTLRRGARAHEIRRTTAGFELMVENIGPLKAGGQQSTEQLSCRSVIIADGGFQSDPAFLRQFITSHPEKILQRGGGTSMGDGVRLAQSLGADLVDMGNFYGHPLCLDAFDNPKLWPYPFLDGLVTSGIVVGADAQRLLNEGNGGVYAANMIARHEDPLSTIVIFDKNIWEGPGKHGAIPPNPHVPAVGGHVEQADSIAELAPRLGLDATVLSRVVEQYNAALQAGKLDSLSPARTSVKYPAMPILQAPFYAIRLCAGITYTMGGIAIDAHSRALKPDGDDIPGLYAVGTAAGGIEGGPKAGYVGGLIISGVTALLAAEDLTSRIRGDLMEKA